MQNPIVALILGLLGGVGGAFAFQQMAPADSKPDTGVEVTPEDHDNLAGRLRTMEQELASLSTPQLQGSATAATPESVDALAKRLDAIEKELSSRVTEEVSKAMEESKKNAGGSDLETMAERMRARQASRKKMNLADASRDLGLTGVQEDALRAAATNYEQKMLELLAGEDGDTESVKADMDKVRQNPEQAMAVMGKYLPRLMPKIGDFMKLETERRAAITEAVGAETARKMQREYQIEELQPFGMPGGGSRFRMGMGR